jgi:competence protein ComEA
MRMPFVSNLVLAVACATALVSTAAPAADAALVNLNTASQKDLEALPGVGEATAKKIVAGRPYSSVDDLAKAGVSKSTIGKLRSQVTVGGAAPAAAAAPAAKTTATKATPTPAPASSGPVDINTASLKDLETLPGVGEATAKKIVAGRPYATVDDLAKAGVSKATIDKLRGSVQVGATAAAKPVPAAAPAPSAAAAKGAGPVDINTASLKDLETLPGVGEVTAKKIVAGRPYTSVDDLAKAGVSKSTIEKLRSGATVSAAPSAASAPAPAPATAASTPAAKAPSPASPPPSAAAPAAPTAASAPAAPAAAPPAASAAPAKATPSGHSSEVGKVAPGEKVNINSASKEDLMRLPGIGPTKAQAIIDGRPYSTPEDIMKVKGIKEGTYGKLKDNITVN